jgi:cell division protein FtsW
LDLPFIGLTFQPSELVKLAIILYLSSLIEKKGDKITSFSRGFLPLSIIVVLFSGLVLMQNDLSSAVLIFIIGMIIMFAAGVNIFAWIGQLVFFAGMSILTVFVIVPEKSDRIKAFFNPEAYQNDSAYQAIKSVEAISNGGFWGKGFGAGTLKYNIPEIHNDSIFAAVAEDVGFIGVFFVILLFVIFGYKGFQTVILNKDEKIKYLISIGITSSIMIQLCMNLAVVANLIPTTGVPLPFFFGRRLIIAYYSVNVRNSYKYFTWRK